MPASTTFDPVEAHLISRNRSRLAGALCAVFFSILMSASPAHAEADCKESETVTVSLPDPVSGRHYEIYVSLPSGYADDTSQTYPLVVLADGGRAFPKLGCSARAMAEGDPGKKAILVGLSYAGEEDLEDSRRRDYTPTKLAGASKAYGEAAAYQTYITNVVLSYIDAHYRVADGQRIFWGHSYGGLLGAHILLTAPSTFQTYILGSPSFWFGNSAILDFETRYASSHRKLDANVILYVGGLETARYDATRKGNTRDMIKGMQQFEKRLRSRNYDGLHLVSTVIPGKDHRSSVGPGFHWGLGVALGDLP